MAGAHALASLTADEIAATAAALREQGYEGDGHRFAYVTLEEPAKGDPAPARRAEALVLDKANGDTWRAVAGLAGGAVET